MIQKQDLFNIRFYKKTWFHGSYKGMCYRIEKASIEEQDVLKVTLWPGPYNFDHTADELKVSECFAFSDEGLEEVCNYLNQYHREHFAQ